MLSEMSEVSSPPIAMDAKIHAFATVVGCMHVWIGELAAGLDVQQNRLYNERLFTRDWENVWGMKFFLPSQGLRAV